MNSFFRNVSRLSRCKILNISCKINTTRYVSGSAPKKLAVLGIETSCDDTGAAVVDCDGNILGEAINSQLPFHIALGGITPPFARDMHAEKIEEIVNLALQRSGMKFQDLDAVATTVKPGLPLSLEVGLHFTKSLLRKQRIPFIPIHHMEAHALTARMIENIEFPFLVLLISGGHCLLAVAKNVEEFLLLGESVDDAPGEAFDKVSRRMKLKNIPQCSKMNGGQAIENLASQGDAERFNFTIPMSKHRNCQFSFSGLKFNAFQHIWAEEEANDIKGGEIIPSINDLCASFQKAISMHIFGRVLRGMAFCERKGFFSTSKSPTLVVSGGVACNKFVKASLKYLCQKTDYKIVTPPPSLCTDNGIMIAWNGLEKLRLGIGIADNPELITCTGRCPLGVSLIDEVTKFSIKPTRVKFDLEEISRIEKDL